MGFRFVVVVYFKFGVSELGLSMELKTTLTTNTMTTMFSGMLAKCSNVYEIETQKLPQLMNTGSHRTTRSGICYAMPNVSASKRHLMALMVLDRFDDIVR